MKDSVYRYDNETGKITTAVYASEDTIDNLINKSRPSKRLFTSDAVDTLIDSIKNQAKDKDLARLFENCFSNTLDTTVFYDEKDGTPDTYVITGDIDAMWLRDSTAQASPYLHLIKDDYKLDKMIQGVINRQSHYINIDPYANSFNKDLDDSPWMGDFTDMRPEIHERKWEIDSLCNHIRLTHMYYKTTGNSQIFTPE